MTIKEFKERIKGLPDDAHIFVYSRMAQSSEDIVHIALNAFNEYSIITDDFDRE